MNNGNGTGWKVAIVAISILITISTSAEVTPSSTNNLFVSGWTTLAAAAQADVYLAVVGYDGDGTSDPHVGTIYAQFR